MKSFRDEDADVFGYTKWNRLVDNLEASIGNSLLKSR